MSELKINSFFSCLICTLNKLALLVYTIKREKMLSLRWNKQLKVEESIFFSQLLCNIKIGNPFEFRFTKQNTSEIHFDNVIHMFIACLWSFRCVWKDACAIACLICQSLKHGDICGSCLNLVTHTQNEVRENFYEIPRNLQGDFKIIIWLIYWAIICSCMQISSGW